MILKIIGIINPGFIVEYYSFPWILNLNNIYFGL